MSRSTIRVWYFSGSTAMAFRSNLLASTRELFEGRLGFVRNLELRECRQTQRNQKRRPPQTVLLQHLTKGNPNQPRAESSLVPKLFQVQVGFQQRLLNHVFDVCVGSHFGLHYLP
jgi:hypothetical protein